MRVGRDVGSTCTRRRRLRLLRAAVLVLLALGGVTGAFGALTGVAQAAFLPASSYPVGAAAGGIGYGDFNGDGIIDLIVTRPTQNDVVVMLGRADGTFSPPSAPIPVGQHPVAVTSCITPYMYGLTGLASTIWSPGQLPSFNSDFHCDVAVSDAGSDDIAVLMGNGDGTFAKPEFVPAGGSPGAIVGTVLDGNFPGIVFAEPQQDRLGVIRFAYNHAYTGPTWTAVGSDPETLIARPAPSGGVGPAVIVAPAVIDVADAGSGDVRELAPTTDQATLETSLTGVGMWKVGSSPVALAGGSFGLAVADRDSGDVTLLGYRREQQGQVIYIYAAQSAPIVVTPSPIGLATVTEAGSPAYGDLAVLNQGVGRITVLQQTSSVSQNDGVNWPTFSQSTIPVPGKPTAIIGQPIHPLLDSSAQVFAAPAATDLAVLDPAGSASVLLQQAPRLVVTPAEPQKLELGQIAAGTTASAEVTVRNVGQLTASVDHLTMFPAPPFWPHAFSIAADHCSGYPLAAGASCTITIRFAPPAPGDFADGMDAFRTPDPASVFGVVRFHGSADLRAAVAAPALQPLSTALSHGLRATGRCSAACRLMVHALLVRRGARTHGQVVLGVARVRLTRARKVKLNISLRARRRLLAHLHRARIVLSPIAEASSYTTTGSKHSTSQALKPVVVVLRSG